MTCLVLSCVMPVLSLLVVRFSLNDLTIVYNTTTVKLKTICQMVKRIIEPADDKRFDRANFKSFGDFSLKFDWYSMCLHRIIMSIEYRGNSERETVRAIRKRAN